MGQQEEGSTEAENMEDKTEGSSGTGRASRTPPTQTTLGFLDFLGLRAEKCFCCAGFDPREEVRAWLLPGSARLGGGSVLGWLCQAASAGAGTQPLGHSYPWNSAPAGSTAWEWFGGDFQTVSLFGVCLRGSLVPSLQPQSTGRVFVPPLRGADSPQ